MIERKWIRGRCRSLEGPVLVSATETVFRSLWSMPHVIWHGRNLLRGWHRIDGAVGVSIKVDVLKRTTYTVSVWRSEQDYYAWVRSPYNVSLMKAYRKKTERVISEKWQVDKFVLEESWNEARTRMLKSPVHTSG